MAKLRVSLSEKIILLLVAIIILIAFIFFYWNTHFLDVYLDEDGPMEWLTVAGLLAGFFVCAYRFINLLKTKSWWFLTVTLVLGVLLFIAAGEEISWGQRIFGIQSSEYFLKHNAQGETNIHNLVVNGVKINKLVFSTILIAALGVYLVIMPLLYKTKTGFKNLIDNCGIPIAKTYQVFSFLVVFSISSLLHHDRNPELLEAGAAALFFLIILHPFNKYIFRKPGR